MDELRMRNEELGIPARPPDPGSETETETETGTEGTVGITRRIES